VEFINEQRFLQWAAQRGIELDIRYEPPQCLVFTSGRASARFWCTPEKPSAIPFFIASILKAMDPWEEARVWKRVPSWWFGLDEDSHEAEHVLANIVRAIGIPEEFRGAIAFAQSEFYALTTLLFAQMCLGWSVNDDVFVVPNHARQIFHVEHHDIVHVSCSDEARIERFVADLAQEGFRLPDRPPDETFKVPNWMSKGS